MYQYIGNGRNIRFLLLSVLRDQAFSIFYIFDYRATARLEIIQKSRGNSNAKPRDVVSGTRYRYMYFGGGDSPDERPDRFVPTVVKCIEYPTYEGSLGLFNINLSILF